MADSNTVLVTGGTGFLGSNTVRHLVEREHDVVVFDISDSRHVLEKLGVGDEVVIRQGDVTEPAELLEAVHDFDVTHVIHLAALLTTAAEDNPGAAIDVNVSGTRNVFEAARVYDDQIERVAWASSASVYAPPPAYDHEWIDEDDLVYPETYYGATKEFCEHLSRVYRQNHDLSLVGLRPQVLYGPYRERGGSTFLTDIIERPALGDPVSVDYGDQLIDWHNVEDVARAFVMGAFAPDDDLSRPVYNLHGENATVREVADLVADIVPDAEIDVSDDGTLPWTARHDMSAIVADIGYEPETDLEGGIREYINTVRTENGLDPIDTD